MLVRKTAKHLSLLVRSEANRSPADIQAVASFQCAVSDPLDLLGAVPRDDRSPLPNGGRADVQRPSDIRGVLKVINNVLLEHGPHVTTVKGRLQPQSNNLGLTSVAMDKRLPTLADRLKSAMDALDGRISASDLSRACGVSPAAVSKWLDGQTKELKAANYADAARALGVREEWLRTGKLPREREGAEEESQVERVLDLLDDLRGPLAALAGAIEQLSKARPQTTGKRRRA